MAFDIANSAEEIEIDKYNLFDNGFHFIVPSFFETIIALTEQKRDFQICFRTFGHDLDAVFWEFNLFCNGKHPAYNGKNSTKLF